MRTGGSVFAIDTNVILRFLVRDDEQLFIKAHAIMQAAIDGQITVLCDPVILAEVVWVLGSHYKRLRAEVLEALEAILISDAVIMPEKARYLRALEIYGNSKAHFADACACAAALEDCDGRLLSFDRKLSSVEEVRRMESLDA